MRPAGDPPVCDCHGEPKIWATDSRRKEGGYWRCAVKRRESHRRYGKSEKGRETNRKACRRYGQSEKGRERDRRYGRSEKGRETNRESCRRYGQSEKGRETKRLCNERRLMVGGLYLGTVGFTEREIKEMIDGATH